MEMRKDLVAPCGMNCRLCHAYQREKNPCQGCRNERDIKYKTKGSNSCIIKNCPVIQDSESGFCFECDSYPCQRLKSLDKRYQGKYHMSMLVNLAAIKESGVDVLLEKEERKWTCASCGGVVCVHKGRCLHCNTVSLEKHDAFGIKG